MRSETPDIPMRRALDRAEELLQAAEALKDAGASRRSREATRHRAVLLRFKKALAPAPLAPLLASLPILRALRVEERAIVFILLARRLRSGRDPIFGRDLLRLLEPRSSALLSKSSLLAPHAPLLTRDLVLGAGHGNQHPLDREYRLSDTAFRGLAAGSGGKASEIALEQQPYYDSIDHLMAMRELLALYRKRAALLFPESFWADQEEVEGETSEGLSHEIASKRTEIREREHRTEVTSLVKFRQDYGLREEEEVVILALLFAELFAASPDMDGPELIRLASATQADVIRYRGLLGPNSHLNECGLVLFERELESKPNLCVCRLPDWVLENLLETQVPRGIPSQERARFQNYLENLRNSEDFFRRL